MPTKEERFHAAGVKFYLASLAYLEQVMGREPTDMEVSAVWATWLRDGKMRQPYPNNQP